MSRYVSYRDFDWLLMSFVLLICALGVMEIHSATMHTKFAGAHIRQLYWIAGGLIGMFLISLLNYQALLEQVHWMYIAAIASLVSVMPEKLLDTLELPEIADLFAYLESESEPPR